MKTLKSNQKTTDVVDGKTNTMILSYGRRIIVGSNEWFDRVSIKTKKPDRFAYHNGIMVFTAHVEKRRNDMYWYAFRQISGKRVSYYLGDYTQLTAEKLQTASVELHSKLANLGLVPALNTGNKTTNKIRVHNVDRTVYTQYLKSSDWKIRRHAALMHADYKCQICNETEQLHVHHRTYANFGNESLNDLTVLCSRCHNIFHNSLREATKHE
jgi:5-methylcytosine-specific restriction endonuclease McrA